MPSNRTHRVAVLPGDGTGPEVVREGLKVLAATGVKLDLEHFDLGGERYKKTGDILPDSVLDELRGFYAFDLTRKRNKMRQLHLVAKTNVLTFVHDTWWRAFNEVGEADYPDIRREYAHVDATAMWFVKNPEWFDVIVVENMFGDIITDLGAMIQGGMGIAAGGNINPQGVSMF